MYSLHVYSTCIISTFITMYSIHPIITLVILITHLLIITAKLVSFGNRNPFPTNEINAFNDFYRYSAMN